MLVAVAVAGCERTPDTVSTTATGTGAQEITWARVVELVHEGRVEWASQTHDLVVSIGLIDGTEYWAMEPQIDAITGLVSEAPNRGAIGLRTE